MNEAIARAIAKKAIGADLLRRDDGSEKRMIDAMQKDLRREEILDQLRNKEFTKKEFLALGTDTDFNVLVWEDRIVKSGKGYRVA